MMKNILFFVSILLAACSVDEGNISGTITNAKDGQWLFLEKLTLNDIEKVDSMVNKDLKLYVKTGAINELDNIKSNLGFWSLVYACSKDGSLSKEDQVLIKKIFGQTKLRQLINLMKELTPNKAQEMVKQKIIDNCDAIRSISKITGWMEIRNIIKDIESKSGFVGIYDDIKQLI